MIDLIKLEGLFFDDARINDQSALNILDSNIQRMKNNNADKLYDQMISDSEKCRDKMSAALIGVGSTRSSRISKTQSINDLLSQVKEEVKQFEAITRGTFKKDSPKYLDIFPQGMKEFYAATRENMPELLGRLSEKATKYKDEIGEKICNNFALIVTDYQREDAEQKSLKGDVSTKRTELGSLRNELNRQLQKNLITILYNNIDKINYISTFFDLTLNPKRANRKPATTDSSTEKLPEIKA